MKYMENIMENIMENTVSKKKDVIPKEGLVF